MTKQILRGPRRSLAGLDPIHRFNGHVAKRPNAPAVVTDGRTLSYADLDRASSSLAGTLLDALGHDGSRVALHLELGDMLVTAILACLKAGVTYVPLGLDWPEARLLQCARQANCRIVLYSGQRGPTSWPSDVLSLSVEDAIHQRVGPIPDVATGVDRPAYALFTSGSTGRPKGVLVNRSALANYLQWATRRFHFSQGSAILVHTPPVFDLSVTSLLGPVVSGGTAVIARRSRSATASLLSSLGSFGINIAKVTPTHLSLLREQQLPDGLHDLVIGGELLTVDQLRFGLPGNLWVHNEYGPTEGTVAATCFSAPLSVVLQSASSTVPIGHPIDNVDVAIHDADDPGRVLPFGAEGELHISGAGVAAGYVDDAPGGFYALPNGPAYRTGDLAVFREGQLWYLGRRDRQIKVAGIRVDPAEVEAAMLRHPEVHTAVAGVYPGSDGRERLVVAYVGYVRGRLTTSGLRKFLRSQLPPTLVPHKIVEVDNVPITSSGKFDVGGLSGIHS